VRAGLDGNRVPDGVEAEAGVRRRHRDRFARSSDPVRRAVDARRIHVPLTAHRAALHAAQRPRALPFAVELARLLKHERDDLGPPRKDSVVAESRPDA
jgi:hypothetical protein